MVNAHFLERVGERYRDFVVVKAQRIEELQCTLKELVHEPTGAQVMHLGCDDPENLFCLSFKTYPASSNGAPHILEHTVLCGSRKFPIKDPFFSMMRRSLNTFMNALTGSDFTCYPASSQVEKDFYNLLEVYLDAVFHPQLKEVSFLQEGHRLEFSEPTNPKSPLEFKGIVYNEMKGTLNSGETRLWHAMISALCPDLTYAFNSGGDPKEIPNLSYEELIEFHETYYHPGRCLFFFYGDLPLKKHLDFIAEKALKNLPAEAPLPPLPLQKRFKRPVYNQLRYPVSDTEDPEEKTMIAFGWLTAPLSDQAEILALTVLDSMLMDTDASPLKMPLLKSGLCIQANAYIDVEMSEVPYAIVCKGCKEENAQELQETLFEALRELSEKELPRELIESAIHQIEMARLEIVGDNSPFGLTLFMRSALAKQHDCPPENALMVHSLFATLRKKIEDPRYLPDLLKKYLLHNAHFVRIVMAPDPKLTLQEAEEEKKRLQKIQERLTPREVDHILRQTQELVDYQKQTQTQNLSCLPKVSIDDVPLLARDFPLQVEKVGGLKIFHHSCFTNQMIYADLLFDLPLVIEEELPYVQLLLSLFSEVGVGKRDYAANLEYLHAHTGGVSALSGLYVQAQNPQQLRPSLSIRSKALRRKADKLLPLMKEMALDVRFDEQSRIRELIEQIDSSLQNRLPNNALKYAIQLSLSGFSTASHISEAWGGLKYYKKMHEMAKDLDTHLRYILKKLHSLKERFFCSAEPHLILSCDDETFAALYKENFFGLTEMHLKPCPAWSEAFALSPVPSQARPIASSVAFNCKAFKTVPYLHPHAPALAAAAQIMDNKILHHRVREQGGAYGVGAHYSALLGNFYFHSYRDPHIARTIGCFDEAIDALAGGQFDATDLEEAKLGLIQQFDVPIAPAHRATTAYAWWREGRTREMRQRFRDHLLALTPKEVQSAVEAELLPQKDRGVAIAFAGKEQIERENALLTASRKSPLPIIPI